MNKMDIERWVMNEVNRNGFRIGVSNRRTKALGNDYPFGEFQNRGNIESLSNWEVVDTIGDGSCLLHSFLILTSPTYNRLSTPIKIRIAQLFRTYLSTLSIFTRQEVMELQNVRIYLDDIVASKIARHLGYGLIIVVKTNDSIGKHFGRISIIPFNRSPYLIILNSGNGILSANSQAGHFEAMLRLHRETSPNELGDLLANLADRLLINIQQNAVFGSPVRQNQQKPKQAQIPLNQSKPPKPSKKKSKPTRKSKPAPRPSKKKKPTRKSKPAPRPSKKKKPTRKSKPAPRQSKSKRKSPRQSNSKRKSPRQSNSKRKSPRQSNSKRKSTKSKRK